MKFCPNCQTAINDDVTRCPNCAHGDGEQIDPIVQEKKMEQLRAAGMAAPMEDIEPPSNIGLKVAIAAVTIVLIASLLY